MMDKDSQLDEIERIASKYGETGIVSVSAGLFLPDGVYYEMRRENEQLRKDVDFWQRQRQAVADQVRGQNSKWRV